MTLPKRRESRMSNIRKDLMIKGRERRRIERGVERLRRRGNSRKGR
jgi:hypothetical protein